MAMKLSGGTMASSGLVKSAAVGMIQLPTPTWMTLRVRSGEHQGRRARQRAGGDDGRDVDIGGQEPEQMVDGAIRSRRQSQRQAVRRPLRHRRNPRCRAREPRTRFRPPRLAV